MGKKSRHKKQAPKAQAPKVVRRDKEKIHVAVPTTDNVVGLGVSCFLAQLGRLSMDPACPYSFSWHVIHGKRPVEYARNVLVGNFLKNTNASRLWFIDSDMAPPDNAIDMLTAEGDVVAPITFAFNHSSQKVTAGLKLCLFKYDLNGDATFQSVIPEDPRIRYTDLDGAGTAAMVIKREVLEDRRLWLDGEYKDLTEKVQDCTTHADDPEFAPPIFRNIYKPNGMILRGEDLDFCIRVKALGYKLTGDFGVHFGHIKQVDLKEVAEFVKDVAYRAQARIGAKANTGVTNASQMDRQEGTGTEGSGVRGRSGPEAGRGMDQAGHLREVRPTEAQGGSGDGAAQDNGRGVPGEPGQPVPIPPAA